MGLFIHKPLGDGFSLGRFKLCRCSVWAGSSSVAVQSEQPLTQENATT